MRLTVPVAAAGVFALRDALRKLCVNNAVDAPVVDEVVLATQEACNNALLHSKTADGTIEVNAVVADRQIRVEVKDQGCGLDPGEVSVAAPPDPFDAHGRGLLIIDRLMDSLEIIPCCPGTLVRMTKAIHSRPAMLSPARRAG
jgi:anti-sigma regulatory factor (Ser/Thr protein kinase)